MPSCIKPCLVAYPHPDTRVALRLDDGDWVISAEELRTCRAMGLHIFRAKDISEIRIPAQVMAKKRVYARSAPRIGRVLWIIQTPDGEEIRIDNLKLWATQTFPSTAYSTIYWSIRSQGTFNGFSFVKEINPLTS